MRSADKTAERAGDEAGVRRLSDAMWEPAVGIHQREEFVGCSARVCYNVPDERSRHQRLLPVVVSAPCVDCLVVTVCCGHFPGGSGG